MEYKRTESGAEVPASNEMFDETKKQPSPDEEEEDKKEENE